LPADAIDSSIYTVENVQLSEQKDRVEKAEAADIQPVLTRVIYGQVFYLTLAHLSLIKQKRR
jgi:hypothetical protein